MTLEFIDRSIITYLVYLRVNRRRHPLRLVSGSDPARDISDVPSGGPLLGQASAQLHHQQRPVQPDSAVRHHERPGAKRLWRHQQLLKPKGERRGSHHGDADAGADARVRHLSAAAVHALSAYPHRSPPEVPAENDEEGWKLLQSQFERQRVPGT